MTIDQPIFIGGHLVVRPEWASSILNNAGGIPSFVDENNGVMVASSCVKTWADDIEGNRPRLADMGLTRIALHGGERSYSVC